MALNKYSAFYYGHTVNQNNRYINFTEPSGSGLQLSALIEIGSTTLTGFADKVAKAMNSAGTQEYIVTLDRTKRTLTISADNNFTLNIDTGNQKAVTAFNLMGFSGADLSGSNSYEGTEASGEAYITQTPLKNFSDFKYNKEKAEAQVKTTPAGITEVISYSTLERMKCDLPLITNYTPQRFIRESNTGVDEAEAFLDYLITKAPVEFIYDYNSPNDFVPCILDKTGNNSKGVGYELREKVRQSLPGYYEISGLVFLKVEVR
jgi:hypothetical protein